MKSNKKGVMVVEVLFIMIVILAVAGISYGGWKLKRYFNYEFEYKDHIQSEIKKMVKKECLIKSD